MTTTTVPVDDKSSLNRTKQSAQSSNHQTLLTPPVLLNLQSVKFDDLCQNFQEHEALDADSPVVTASVDATGAIVGMTLESTGVAGVIPVTVPTSDAATVSIFYIWFSSNIPIAVGFHCC